MTANGMEDFGADQCSMHGPPTEPTLTPAELQKRIGSIVLRIDGPEAQTDRPRLHSDFLCTL